MTKNLNKIRQLNTKLENMGCHSFRIQRIINDVIHDDPLENAEQEEFDIIASSLEYHSRFAQRCLCSGK